MADHFLATNYHCRAVATWISFSQAPKLWVHPPLNPSGTIFFQFLILFGLAAIFLLTFLSRDNRKEWNPFTILTWLEKKKNPNKSYTASLCFDRTLPCLPLQGSQAVLLRAGCENLGQFLFIRSTKSSACLKQTAPKWLAPLNLQANLTSSLSSFWVISWCC